MNKIESDYSVITISTQSENDLLRNVNKIEKPNECYYGKWTPQKIRRLICLRGECESEFKGSTISNNKLWEKIGLELGMSTSQCRDKWNYLVKKYKEYINNLRPSASSKSRIFFDYEKDMAAVMKQRLYIKPQNVTSNDYPISVNSSAAESDDENGPTKKKKRMKVKDVQMERNLELKRFNNLFEQALNESRRFNDLFASFLNKNS